MACNDNISNNCTKKQYSVCIEMDGVIPEFSPLSSESCINLQEVADDLYVQVGNVRDNIDVSELEAQCLTLPTNKNVVSFINMLMTKVCELQERIEELESSQQIQDQQIQDLQNDVCPEL